MHNFKKGVAIVGASAAIGGCSPIAHPQAAPKPTHSLAPESLGPTPSPRQSYPSIMAAGQRYKHIARIAHNMEVNFVHNIHEHPVAVNRALGTCAVIAYKPQGTNSVVALIAPDAVALGKRDKKTGISISIAAAFDPFTTTIVFGPVRTAYRDIKGAHTKTLQGTTREIDMFPPQVKPSIGHETVVWSANKDQVVDASSGKPAMEVGSVTELQKESLRRYVSTDNLAQGVCLAGMQLDGLITSSAPVPAT